MTLPSCIRMPPVPSTLASEYIWYGLVGSGMARTGASTSRRFIVAKAVWHSGVQVKAASFTVRAVIGTSSLARFGMKRLQYCAMPTKVRTSPMSDGVGHSVMILVFAGSIDRP